MSANEIVTPRAILLAGIPCAVVDVHVTDCAGPAALTVADDVTILDGLFPLTYTM